ncbi:MAG: hypothetical protein FWC65_02985 [Treponema sp.]|nr:hypothetical protein [Treponema sp.]
MGLLSRLDQFAGEKSALGAADERESDFIENEIAQFHQQHLNFSCLVFENPSAQPDFCEKFSAIIGGAGTVIPLAFGRPLVMLPSAADRELIAHRLSKSLDTTVLLSFEADNPENVITRIDSLK